jgi:hypothetical protein
MFARRVGERMVSGNQETALDGLSTNREPAGARIERLDLALAV